jgi:hypothetical protein
MAMKFPRIGLLLPVAVLLSLPTMTGFAQSTAPPPTSPAALNASISDFGTSFVFDPPVICSGCVETELGFESLSSNDGRYLPTVLTLAPLKTHTDFSVLVNALESELMGGRRITQFGDRFDFVIRQQVMQKGGFLLTVAPRGTVFTRRIQGGRVGGTFGPQWSRGNNLIAANFTWTEAIGVSTGNPRSDYVGAADYFRTLDHRGTAIFLGLQHELAAGQQTIGTEAGLILPFRNGQVELASQQLDLNSGVEWQFQARVIVNWQNVLRRR